MDATGEAPCKLHDYRLKHLEARDYELNGSIKAVADELKQVRLDLPDQLADLKGSVSATIRNWFVGTIIVLVISRVVEGLLP